MKPLRLQPAAPVAQALPIGPAALITGAVLLFIVLAYFDTATSITSIWNRSETYAHGYFIAPISAWLVWRQRAVLAQMTAAPCWPALLLLAGCGACWLLAELTGIQVVAQYCFVAMLPLAVLTVLGPRMAGVIAFPLMFLLLAVPVGDSLLDPLMTLTANGTVFALRATGIPVLHEGNHLTLPTGSWSVIEACSGLRYLIASLTAGCLYAYLTYRSYWRRTVFIVLSALMPLLANSMRAYLIVMIGHLSDMTQAVGFDHLIYGWVFFGIVIFVLFWAGGRWREEEAEAPVFAPMPGAAASPRRPALAALAIACCLGVWPAYAYQLLHRPARPVDTAALSGFAPSAVAPFADWQPHHDAPAAQLQRSYLQDGQPVGLTVLYYRDRNQAGKLISSSNLLVPMVKSDWRATGGTLREETLGARQLAVREDGLASNASGKRLLVWSWYAIDGGATVHDYAGKLMQLQEKLRTGSDDGAFVAVYAPYDEQPEQARATLRAFVAAHLAALDGTLAQVAHGAPAAGADHASDAAGARP